MRGGYGIYFGMTRSTANGVGSYGTQGYNVSTGVITTYNNDGATPIFTSAILSPTDSSNRKEVLLGLLNDVGYGAIGPIRGGYDTKTPYEQSWSLGFERQTFMERSARR